MVLTLVKIFSKVLFGWNGPYFTVTVDINFVKSQLEGSVRRQPPYGQHFLRRKSGADNLSTPERKGALKFKVFY